MEHSIPRHIRLTSHPGNGWPGRDSAALGSGRPGRARPCRGEPGRAAAPQRDRLLFRLLCNLSRARGGDAGLGPRSSAGSDRHRAGGADRAASAMGRSRRRSCRSTPGATSSARCSPSRSAPGSTPARRSRSPTARIAMPELRPLARRRRLAARRAGRCSTTARSASPRRRSTRSGTCPGSPPGSASPRPICGAPCSRKPAGMFPELVTRPDLEVLLPPIGGTTVYFFGDVERIAEPDTVIACRVHDECNGSDVFGSDICTCRPYLVHGIEVCVETAQQGGVGIIVYNRKEGRALGEVTKFLVYNARKRQARRRPRRHLFPPHRMRRRRAGHAVSGADAGRVPLARHPPHRPLGVDVEPEATTRSTRRGSRSSSRSRSRTAGAARRARSRSRRRRPPAISRRPGSPDSAASCSCAKGRALDELRRACGDC